MELEVIPINRPTCDGRSLVDESSHVMTAKRIHTRKRTNTQDTYTYTDANTNIDTHTHRNTNYIIDV
mgnify:FL=1